MLRLCKFRAVLASLPDYRRPKRTLHQRSKATCVSSSTCRVGRKAVRQYAWIHEPTRGLPPPPPSVTRTAYVNQEIRSLVLDLLFFDACVTYVKHNPSFAVDGPSIADGRRTLNVLVTGFISPVYHTASCASTLEFQSFNTACLFLATFATRVLCVTSGAQDDGCDEEAPVSGWLHNEGCEVEEQRRRNGDLKSGHHVGGLDNSLSAEVSVP